MPGIDWNDAIRRAEAAQADQTKRFEPLPMGPYNFRCVEATAGRSKNDKPQIKAKYEVEDGQYAGRTVLNFYTLTLENDNALSFFFEHMAAHGLDHTFFASNPPFEQVAAALVSRRVRVELTQTDVKGKIYNNMESVMPPLGSPNAPVVGAAPPVVAAQTPVAPAPVPQAVAPQPAAAPAQPAAQPEVVPQVAAPVVTPQEAQQVVQPQTQAPQQVAPQPQPQAVQPQAAQPQTVAPQPVQSEVQQEAPSAENPPDVPF